MVITSHSAECTAPRDSTMPTAPSSASGARIQNAICSPPVSVAASVAVSATA